MNIEQDKDLTYYFNLIKDIKEDFEEAIKLSHLVTKKEASPKLLKGLWQAILRLFAPLM